MPQSAPITAPKVEALRTLGDLRGLYAQPTGRAVFKEIAALDKHCRSFIALSPFLVLSTCDEAFQLDASPRGGEPGFVKVDGQGRLLIPDSPGNNRLDSLQNIVRTGQAGLLFMIPGFDETLRVNGAAEITTDEAAVALCTTERRAPKSVIRVTVKSAYLHCPKAFLRSKLWSASSQVERTRLPTSGQMISEQTGIASAPETREEMERRYAPDL